MGTDAPPDTLSVRTPTLARPRRPGARVLAALPVLGLALLTAVLRLPHTAAPLTADEGGYLVVARQWGPGSSLYGDYWVDRPPLLLELYRWADSLGGLPALRLLGCLAAGITVLGVGLAARRAAGPRAGTWAATIAGALLVSPLIGAVQVDGELLAAPFVAVGVWLSIIAVDVRGGRGSWAALGAGACAAGALLVKQNMLDVAVFALALGLAHRRRAGSGNGDLRRLLLRFVGGGLLTVILVLGLASLRGTSPGAVLYAMYPFRLEAAGAVGHVTLGERLGRLGHLAGVGLLSGAPLVLAGLVIAVVAARRASTRPRSVTRSGLGSAVAVATLALAAYDVVSVVAGGSFWLHYLVQLVVPTALAAGLLATTLRNPGRSLLVVVLASSAVAWTTALVHRTPAQGQVIGSSIGRVAEPGDTVVTAFGDASILRAAGLESPYPYLWSLPARTLDPRFDDLGALLAGPDAPTWLVVRGPGTLALLESQAPGVPLRSRYERVGEVCGRIVHLRRDVRRPAPIQTGECHHPVSPWFVGAPQPEAAHGMPVMP